MKLIKPSFEILEQKPRAIAIPADMTIGPRMVKEELLNSVYKQIEIAGRTCYKSEDKITETSAKEFVERMVKSGHGAMLEHGTVYLMRESIKDFIKDDWNDFIQKYKNNPYSKAVWCSTEGNHGIFCITTNYRVLVENDWLNDLQYLCEPTKHHEKRHTVKFICDRGVWNEFIRHRVFQKIDEDDVESFGSIGEDGDKFSFAQESTRYCNYSKDKFGKECTFIIPCWVNNEVPSGNYTEYREINRLDGWACWEWLVDECAWYPSSPVHSYLASLMQSEKAYFDLLDEGWKPQQARTVLPNALKTELVMTGFASDWEHFFMLRDAGSAHPQAYELAHPLHEEFIKRGYLQ